jgi:hypothetical protein
LPPPDDIWSARSLFIAALAGPPENERAYLAAE